MTFCLTLVGCVSLQAVSPANMKAYELSLAVDKDRAAVAWHGGVTGADAIFLQALDSAGRAAGSPHQITDGQRYAYEPDLQFVEGDPLLAWYEKDVANGSLTAWLARTDTQGRVVWKRQLDAVHGSARNPVVRVSNDVICVAWIEKHQAIEVFAERFDADGNVVMAAKRVGMASDTTWKSQRRRRCEGPVLRYLRCACGYEG
ncbi:MAG: hypothetical protein QM773_01450 [Hyphomonadaceae bacterium]